ncbi:MAG: hypothetical protein IJL51_07820 [Oscillospiraceae bacterium]|nr:hypothetical protein [Oscillospiraceae bacterium]
MNLKKGLSLVAFGFLFTLVNLNLTFNGSAVNIMPDFVGWILFFLAIDPLGDYAADKKYLKWAALVLAVFTAAFWLLEIAMPELDPGLLKTLVSVAEAVYMFLLFGVLEKIAHDYGSQREGSIRTLKILNLALFAGFVVIGLLAAAQGSLALTGTAAVLGVAALVAYIVTMVTLFKLKREIAEKTERMD